MSRAVSLRLAAESDAAVPGGDAGEGGGDREATEKEEPSSVEPAPAPPVPSALTMPANRAILYGVAAIFLSLAQGLGMNAIAANINQIQGSFGVTATEATWLMAA